MADYKPLILVFLCFFAVGGFLNFAIAPFVDESTPDPDSVLEGFSNFLQDGWVLNITIPVFGTVNVTVNLITWLWLGIDPVTTFMVEQINLLTYLSDYVAVPLLIIFIISLAYVILTLIRGN